jgi:hypothetical protein
MEKAEETLVRSEDSIVNLILVTKYREKFVVTPKNGAWPITVFHDSNPTSDTLKEMFCYPIFDGSAHNNLYGRLMTIVEAVIEDKDRQKAVKDIVARELSNFSKELSRSATEIANGGGSSENIYTR